MMDREYASADAAMPGLSVGSRVGAAANQIEPEISAAANEVAHLGKLVAETRSNLGQFIDRTLLGDAPAAFGDPTQERARRNLNSGSTGSLRREIELATEIAEDVLRLSNRLRQIG